MRPARDYYRSCVERAKLAYKNRTLRNGKEHVSFLCVSFDYAEDIEVPSHNDQEGALFFLSPMRLSIAGATDEGSEENMMLLLPEKAKIKKCGSGVASFLLEFLKRRNCTFDEIVVFTDNTASQSKNVYFFALLATIAVKALFGCKYVRLSFLCVGHTKFAPDRWFGLTKRKIRHTDVNTVLDVGETIFATGCQETARALGYPGHSNVAVFSHCPLSGKPMFETFNFERFVSTQCHKLNGHSLWYDVIFQSNGTVLARGAPCGKFPNTLGYFWEEFGFLLDGARVKSLDLSTLGRCTYDVMRYERAKYLFEKIRPF